MLRTAQGWFRAAQGQFRAAQGQFWTSSGMFFSSGMFYSAQGRLEHVRDILDRVRDVLGQLWDVLEPQRCSEQCGTVWGVSGCVRAFPQLSAAAPGLLGAVQRNSLEPSGGTAGAGRGFCTFRAFGAA